MAESTLTKQNIRDNLQALRDYVTDSPWQWGAPEAVENIDAIAAWLAAACVVEGGHRWQLWSASPEFCANCGQRRAEAEGGR